MSATSSQTLPKNSATAEGILRKSIVAMMEGLYNKDTLSSLDSNLLEDALNFRVTAKPVQSPASAAKDMARKRTRDEELLEETPITPSTNTYAQRTNRGVVVATHNADQIPLPEPMRSFSLRTQLEVYSNTDLEKYRTMFEKPADRYNYLQETQKKLGNMIVRSEKLKEPTSSITMFSQDLVVSVGRIACDTSEGKINAESVLLYNGDEKVALDLRDTSSFSLFPGQVVAVEGVNASGSKLTVSKLFDDATAPRPKVTEESLNQFMTAQGNKPVTVFVCAGPYSTADNLDYDPLSDLVDAIKEQRPDVVIFIGPFVDSMNNLISESALDDSFEDIYVQKVQQTIKQLCLDMPGLQAIVIPSVKDVHHQYVFPQPPLPHPMGEFNDRCMSLSNPVMFSLNDVTFAISSTDVITDLAKQETSRLPVGAKPDRMASLYSHLLKQRSFYPIYPPAPGLPLDFTHASALSLLQSPDILIVPTVFRNYIKVVDSTLCLNPGKLVAGKSGGVYARLVIQPTTFADRMEIAQRTRVDIIQI